MNEIILDNTDVEIGAVDFEGFDDEDEIEVDDDEIKSDNTVEDESPQEDTGENAKEEEADDEADQPETEAEPESAKDKKTDDAKTDDKKDGDKTADKKAEDSEVFTLKCKDETKLASREETIALAQMGMHYPEVREERDNLRSEMPKYKDYESFLSELAADSGSTVDELIDDVRATMLVSREANAGRTISDLAAKEQIKREREARGVNRLKTEQTKDKATEEPSATVSNDSFVQFVKDYPDVKAQDIPEAVWNDFRAGKGEMSALYAKYENARLKTEIEALKSKESAKEQNAKNKERSTGSRKSAGETNNKNMFEGWDDDE